jgi:2-amino-4-hydroxy-6-hydroxymethyldihydropteridine diphosphokinase
MLHTAFVGLGSNLEDPSSQLQRAFADLDGLPETRLVARSSLYRSAPVGYLDQPDFVNAVAQLETGLTPQVLLQSLLDIEHRHGRERTFRNAPRTLDLDVLLYDDLQMHEHGLTIPHPQMHLRAFVLQPLLELAPGCAIPGVGSAAQALDACGDQMLERMQDVAG